MFTHTRNLDSSVTVQQNDSDRTHTTKEQYTKRVKLQVVKIAPDNQSLNLLSVNRLITILNEADQCGVVCKLDRGVFRCAVIHVQGKEQWGENAALRSSSADCVGAGWEFSQPHYLLSVCQEADDPLTDGGGDGELCQFILKGVWDDGVKSGAEVYKQEPHISPWSVQMLQDEVQSYVDCIIHGPVCSVGKLQGSSKGQVEVIRKAKTKMIQMISWLQTLEPRVCNH